MNRGSGAGNVETLPSVEEPLPAYLGRPGLKLLRLLIKDLWRSDRPKLTAEQEAELRDLAAALEQALVPAKPAVLGGMLEALMWHYPAVPRSEAAAESVAADWLRDLGHLPDDIVDAACTNWRRGQNSYAPSPGHMLAIANPILSARRQLLHYANRLIPSVGPGADPRNIPPVGSVKAAVGLC